MATSGCPHMEFLRPLTRFHLPFSTPEETIYRVTSYYLLKQYIENKNKGVDEAITLDTLNDSYANVEEVNKGMLARLHSISKGDADKNALVILNNFSQMIGMEIEMDYDSLSEFFGFN